MKDETKRHNKRRDENGDIRRTNEDGYERRNGYRRTTEQRKETCFLCDTLLTSKGYCEQCKAKSIKIENSVKKDSKRCQERRDLTSDRRADEVNDRRGNQNRRKCERREMGCPVCDSILTSKGYCEQCKAKVIKIRND